ncbi:MAG: hypothetical protein J7647_22445 [Cyanobacteria bacterium SBLK]|nr:hypothetical protein [Cyanobacteria bacterium SBLK]
MKRKQPTGETKCYKTRAIALLFDFTQSDRCEQNAENPSHKLLSKDLGQFAISSHSVAIAAIF